jgi:plasmid stabilization system protein ParE
MNFRIEVTSRAERDIDEIVSWIAQRSPQGASSWLRRLEEVFDHLVT